MRKYNTTFSCGFFANSLNFEANGLETNALQVKPDAVSLLYSSLTNFLERGYPTRPTHYLEGKIQSLIPNFSWGGNVAPTHTLVRPFKPSWDDTIKGFEENRLFPARHFFNNLIEEHLPNYSFIKNLIIPECKFKDILASPVTAGANPEWEVDFFLPCANLVIEIDGSQHDQFANRVNDNTRDRILRKHGISTHRVSAYKIERNSVEIRDYFKALKILLASNKEVQEIKAFVELERFKDSNINFDLIALARLQRIVVELLKNKTLKSGGRIELKADFKTTIDWPQLAIEDLRNTYNILKFRNCRRIFAHPRYDTNRFISLQTLRRHLVQGSNNPGF
jgi:ATP-dependent DNA helicase RecQ